MQGQGDHNYLFLEAKLLAPNPSASRASTYEQPGIEFQARKYDAIHVEGNRHFVG